MLISTGLKEGNIVTLKLTSGEEVIGKLVTQTESKYTVSKPMVLSMSQQGVGMIPYVITAEPDADISVNKSAVVLACETRKDAASSYLEQTTGISLG
jgi:hypothetical protein